MKKLLIATRQRLGSVRIARSVYRNLPSGKRCKECLVPFLEILLTMLPVSRAPPLPEKFFSPKRATRS